MVKIVDGEKEEVDLKRKVSDLEKLARHFFAREKIPGYSGEKFIVMSDTVPFLFGIEVDASRNIISVCDPNYFDRAKKIAEAYEKTNPPPEIIISTNYSYYRQIVSSRRKNQNLSQMSG